MGVAGRFFSGTGRASINVPVIAQVHKRQKAHLGQIKFPLHGLDMPGKAGLLPILYDLAYVNGRDPYNLHDLYDL